MARLEQVIIADEVMGKGSDGSPIRRVTAFYRVDGTPLGHVDPCAPHEDRATGEWVFSYPARVRCGKNVIELPREEGAGDED